MRPTRPAARIRRVTRSTSPITAASSASAEVGRAAERPLRPDRAAPASGPYRPRVEVVRERVEMAPRCAPEHRDEHRLRQQCDLPHLRDPARAELRGRHRPDAPEPLDRERVQERELLVRRDDEQPVRLRDRARDLGEELRPGDADRDRQPDPLSTSRRSRSRDLDRRPEAPLHPAHVEEGLVDREALDERRRVVEHLEDGLARLDVGGEARLDDDRVRAEARAPGARSSPSERRTPSPRSSPRARRPRRRAPAARAGSARPAARRTRRTRPGRRAGSSPLVDTNICSHSQS